MSMEGRSRHHRVQSEGTNLAYLQYNISRNQKIYFADRLSRQVQKFATGSDWTISYQTLPNGEAPGWMKAFSRAIDASAQGAMHAYQNRVDLQIAYDGLVSETLKLRGQSTELPAEKALQAALTRLAAQEGANGPIKQMLNKYSFTDHRFRILTSEDPSLLPRSLRTSRNPIHSQMDLHDRIVGIGRFVEQGGETLFQTHTAFGMQFAQDADGDQLTHGLVFRDRVSGQIKRVIAMKAPGHRRMGYYQVQQDVDPLASLQASALGLRAYTPSTYGDVRASVQAHALDPLQKELERIRNRKAILAAMNQYGTDEFKKTMVNGISGQDLYDEEVKSLTKMLNRGRDIGMIHNKVVSREIFRAFEAMARGEVEGVTAADLNRYFASNLAKSDERFKILELNAIKQVKNSGRVALDDEDIEEFRLVMKDTVKTYIQKTKTLPSMNKVDYLEMIGDLVGENGIDALAKADPDALRKVFEAHYFSIGSGIQRGMRSADQNPFRTGWKASTVRRRSGLNPLMKDDSGIFDVLEEAGFYELKPILRPDDMVPEELQNDFGKMYAIFERPDLGLKNSPIRSAFDGSENAEGLIHTGVLRGTLISDADKKVRMRVNAREGIRRFMNQNYAPTFTISFKGERANVELGEMSGLYTPSALREEIHAARVAADFVRTDLDLIHTGLSPESSKIARETAMKRLIQTKANQAPTDPDFRRFITQAQLASREGQKLVREAREGIKQYVTEFGFAADVSRNQFGATLQGRHATSPEVGRVNVSLVSQTNDPRELAEAIIYGRSNLPFADAAGKMKNNRTVAVELGSALGIQYRLGNDVGATAKRIELIRSQLSSVKVQARAAFTEVDLVEALRAGTNMTPQEIADKYFAGLTEDVEATGRQGRSGVGMMYTTDGLNDRIMEEIMANPQASLNLDNLSDAEAKRLGAYKKNGKWVLSIKDWDNLRKYTKLIDETGTFKIEQTRISGIRTAGGETLDALAFGGELAAKRKFGDLGLNLITMQAGKKGYSDTQMVDLLQGLFGKIKNLTSQYDAGEISQDALNKGILDLYQPYLEDFGFTRERITATIEGKSREMEAYVGTIDLFGAMNHSELPNQLSRPRPTDIRSEFGQKDIDFLAHHYASMLADETGADYHKYYNKIGKMLIEVGPDLERSHRDALGTVKNRDLIEMAEGNEQVMAQLYQILTQNGGTTSRQFTPRDAYQAGRNAAMAEFMGGTIYQGVGHHLDDVFGKMSWKSAGMVGGVIAGAQILKQRKDSKKKS